DLIGTPNLFRDLTGVDLNIQNAGAALSSALGAAQSFGDQAAKLAQQQYLSKNTDRVLAAIADAKKKKLISDEQAQDLTARALGASLGKPGDDAAPTQSPAVQKAIKRASASENGRVTVKRPSGTVDVRSGTDPAASFDVSVDPPVGLVTQTGSLL